MAAVETMKDRGFEPGQAASFGSDPNVAFMILLNAPYNIARESISGGEANDSSVRRATKQAVPVGGHPDLARTTFTERIN